VVKVHKWQIGIAWKSDHGKSFPFIGSDAEPLPQICVELDSGNIPSDMWKWAGNCCDPNKWQTRDVETKKGCYWQ
jgi:hypothetical protein